MNLSVRPVVLACVAALICATAEAAPAPAAAPASAAAKAVTRAAALPKGVTAVREVEGVSEYRLANGLQVLLIPDASQPKVTVNVTYRVGSRMEGYGETGMAHLLEHLMFKSTPTYPNIGAELSKRGMQFNGTTDVDRTNYFETFPADAAQLAWALKTEAERMTRANVSRKDLDTEMTVVRNEMERNENDPGRMLLEKTKSASYLWHAYGRGVIGARSDVENVNIPHLQAFYKKYYQPDNATLIVAGKFDPAATLAEIAKAFGPLPKPQRALEPSWTVEPVQDGEHEVTLRRVGGFQMLLSMYHVPAMGSPDFAAFQAIANVLGDAPNGRLHKRLVEAGKATQVFGWAEERAEPGEINLGVVLKKDDKLDEAQQILLSTIEGLAKEPITAEELKRAQVQYANGYEKLLSDPQSLCLSLSTAIAGGDWRLLFVERDRIAALTLDQVNATARDWLKQSNRTLGRFIPEDKPDRPPFAGKVSAEEAMKGYVPKAAMAAGEVFDPSPANIDARTERYVLPNGMKVALLPKKTRGEEVHAVIALHVANLDSVKGHVTAANAVVPMLAMGTQHHTRAQLADAFDALHTTWSVSGGATQVRVGLDSKRADVTKALALAAEMLREPAFPASELEQQVRERVSGIEHGRTEPQAVAPHELQRALQAGYPADDPRYVPTFDEELERQKGLTRDQLLQYYQANWGADHGEVAIVGDFAPAAVKAELARLFGDWKAKTPYAYITNPPSSKVALKLRQNLKDKDNAIAIGELPLSLRDEDPDYPALTVAAHVLGAGGFDSRLLTRLRQKEGVSYSVAAWIEASSKEPSGGMGFYAIFAPQNLNKVEQGFTEELARFVKDGVTAEELAQAKKAVLAQRKTSRASEGALASGWAERLDLNRTYAWSGQLDQKIEALTLEQVNAAIRKWIDPSRIDWSVAGDFEKKAP